MSTNKVVSSNLDVASCRLLINMTFRSEITPTHNLVLNMEHTLDKKREELIYKIQVLKGRLEVVEHYRSMLAGITI